MKYSISCKRKSAGNKYKVTYKVKYKFLNDPKISGKRMSYEDWAVGWYHPTTLYTVFDYQTGKSIEKKNNLGVKVKGGKWKYSYYPKQYFKYTDQTTWIRNQKTVSGQFTVTYPKNCKDVVVGIGFCPEVYDFTEAKDTDYWNRKEVYGKTSYYKKGRKTISYMRLN